MDTSALVAIVLGEAGWEKLLQALNEGRADMPASVLTELNLVCARRSEQDGKVAEALISSLVAEGLKVVPFEWRHALITLSARTQFGKGNGRGGLLNFGDLMVYAIAKDYDQSLLCTGRDFTSTDLVIHPASRRDE